MASNNSCSSMKPIVEQEKKTISTNTMNEINTTNKNIDIQQQQQPQIINNIALTAKQQKLEKLKSTRTSFENSNFAFYAFISILLFILIICVTGTSSLNCYHCSSVDNPDCDEAFTGRANITDTDCEKHIGRPAKVCRKIVQYIEQKKVVIRSCGYIDDHEEKDRKPICYKRSGTFAIMMESCNCYEDNCNHSASLVPNKRVLLALIISCSSLILYNSIWNGGRVSPASLFGQR